MVRVVSCRYLRISCSEDDHPLFRRYYARSNRERGVKLLRCFPHCCPEHVQRCYCGSSVHVLVTFAAASSRRNLLVCARFEPSRVVPLWPLDVASLGENDETKEHRLRPGEVTSLPETLLSNDNRQATPSAWIRADREGQSKQTYQNAVLFVLNNHRFPKWLYSYDSSVTRTQREMTHHLVVYVCQLTGTSSQSGEIDVAVLARHESPGFSLISYRRSGNNGRDAGCEQPAIDADASTKFTAVASDSMEVDAVGWTSAEAPTEEHKKEFDKWAFPRPIPGTAEDEYFWQHRLEAANCGFREKGQHLLILWRFLQSISLKDLKRTEADSKKVRSFWVQAVACFRSSEYSRSHHDGVASLLMSIFEHRFDSSATEIESTEREFASIRVAAHLFLRAVSSHTVQRLLLSACTTNDTKTSRSQLQKRFLLLISDAYDTLSGVLHELARTRESQHVSIPTLVDKVLSLVFSLPRYHHLRGGFTALLMDQQPARALSETLNHAFHSFTALVREGMIASATRYRYLIRNNDKIWNQRWLL